MRELGESQSQTFRRFDHAFWIGKVHGQLVMLTVERMLLLARAMPDDVLLLQGKPNHHLANQRKDPWKAQEYDLASKGLRMGASRMNEVRFFVAAIGGEFHWPERPIRIQFGGDDFELRPATAETRPLVVLSVVPNSYHGGAGFPALTCHSAHRTERVFPASV